MKILCFISLCLLSILLSSLSISGEIDSKNLERWEKLESVTATKNDIKIGVYENPRNPNNLIIYPGCWSIMLDTKEVVSPSCHFKLKENVLYCDTALQNRRKNGSVSGIAWDDPKIQTSFFSLLFRRPVFKTTSVKFWDGEYWVEITRLSRMKGL